MELLKERTATSTTFENPDGTRNTRVFASPVYMQDAAGDWVEIDTSLHIGSDGRIQPASAPAKQEFAPKATDPMLARLVLDDDHSVGFGLIGASPLSLAVTSGSKVTYPNALGTASVTLTAKRNGMKEELILAAPGGPTTFDFALHLEGLTAAFDPEKGDVVYRDESGTERARTPRGYMTDAAFEPHTGRSKRHFGVAYGLVAAEDGNTLLRMTLDEAWLADPSRQWPVVVDPSYWLSTDFQDDTYVTTAWTADNGWEPYLPIGTDDGGWSYFDSYMNFDISALNNRDILSATLAMHNVYSPTCDARGVGVYRVTHAWGGHSMTGWPGAVPGEQVAWAAFAKGAPGCPAGWQGFDVGGTVHNWTHGTWGQFGLMLAVDGVSVNDNNAFKLFDAWDACGGGCTPHIDIWWNTAPSTPSLIAPGHGSTDHNLTPTLQATSSDPNANDTIHYQYEICGVIHGVQQCGSSGRLANGTSWQVHAGWLSWNQSYNWRAIADDGTAGSDWSGTWTYTPTNQTPSVPTALSPAGADAVVGTSTLSFTANPSSDANGDPVKYRFQVATGSDGQTGRMATSTWQTSTTWTPPPGTFADGGTYHWTVQAQDSWGATTSWQSAQQFRIDFRLGKRETMSYDELGGAAVNLSNGNLTMSFASPSFPTVGGPVGVTFSYNSQTPIVHGMVGDYHQDLDADGTIDAGEPNLLHRIDTGLNFSWGAPGDGPNPGVLDPEHWVGHWTGAIRVPAGTDWGEDDYVFVSDRSDDSVTLRTGGATGPVVLSAPGCCQYVTGSSVRLSPTSATPLDLVFNQVTGPQSLRIKIRKASAPAGSEIDIPSDWLFTTTPALPDGWSRTADSPVPNAFTAVRPVTGRTTAVVDHNGTDHLWTWNGSSWTPPADEDGVLAQNADGTWALSGDDGYLYTFRADGRVSSIVSAVDDIRPGAPVYAYQPTANGVVRLRTITDAAGRAITFSYAPSVECPVPPVGYDTSAPADMLCKISYGGFDGTETRLYYSGGHLARIADPAGATTDFGYDTSGRLSQVRDELTNDLIAGGIITDGAADTHKTLIDYDAGGRVASVKAPVPDGSTTDAQRARHTFTYTVNATTQLVTQAKVGVAGLSGGAGQPAFARQVDLDSGGHATRDIDTAGIAVDTVWDNLKDRPNRVTDGHFLTSPAGGLVTTVKYDPAGRVTDTYGPAPAGEFAADGTSTTAPRVHTNYDEGMAGLAAAWYASPELTGAPKAHTTSDLDESWGSGSPASGVPADNFSGRLTGEVTVPSTAVLTLNADGGRIYVDGALASGDTWGGPYRAAVRADNPSNHWRLGEVAASATAVDAGGYAPGTYTGGVTKGTAGALAADGDKAASFDGTSGYVGASGMDGAFAASFTVEAWAKFDAVNRGADNSILGHGVAVPRQGLHIGERAGKPYFGFYGDDLAGNASLQTNTWYHLAFSYDGAQNVQRIYVNGSLDSQRTAGGSYQGSGGAARIGSYTFGGFMDGVLDEVAVYRSALPAARVTAHSQAGPLTSATAQALMAAGTHQLRVDYQELSGNAGLSLTSSVSGTTFAPRYNLATSRKDANGRWTKTEYAAPETGLATASVVDPVTVNAATSNPTGANLVERMSYEAASSTTFFRRTSKTLPKGELTPTDPDDFKSTYSYFGITETASNPCPGGQTGINQAGAVKTETAADPDGTGPKAPIVREHRYDKAGWLVASRVVGDAAWTCTSYDDRGRVTSHVDSSGKSTTTSYTVPGRVTKVETGSDNTTRTTVAQLDWLGRTLSYTDELGTTTRYAFDQVGRRSGAYRTFAGQPETTIQTFAYNTATGRLASMTEHLSGGPRTTTYSYNAAGQPTSVTRPNGVVTTTGYDTSRGWVSTLSNTKTNAELSHWTYGHSPSGDVSSEVADTLGRTRIFGHDGAGRLTSVGGTTSRSYAWDANTNRCAQAADCNNPQYTYDKADRLLTSPFATDYTYDAHGNLTSATPNGAVTSQAVDDSWAYDTAASTAAHEKAVNVNTAGTLSASVDSSATPVYTTGSPTGSLPMLGSWTTTIPVRGASYLDTAVTWTSATGGFANVTARYKDATGTIVKTATGSTGSLDLSFLAPATPGTYTLELVNNSATRNVPSFNAPWSATVVSVTDATPSLGAGALWTTPLGAQDQGRVAADVVFGQDSHVVSTTPTASVGAGGAASRTIRASAPGALSASLDWNAIPTYTETTRTGALQAGETTTFPVPVSGSSYLKAAITWTPAAEGHASLRVRVKNGDATLYETNGGGGTWNLTYATPDETAYYVLEIANMSSTRAVPSFSLTWGVTTLGPTTLSGSLAPGATAGTALTADGRGHLFASLDWATGKRSVSSSISGTTADGPTATGIHQVAVPTGGTVTGSLDWGDATGRLWVDDAVIPGSLGGSSHADHPITVGRNGRIDATLGWDVPEITLLNPDLALVLLDSAGTEVANSDVPGGNQEHIEFDVTGTTYPTTAAYTLRVVNKGMFATPYDMNATFPIVPDLDLELYDPSGTKVAESTTTTSKPETLSYNAQSAGTYTFKVRSRDPRGLYTANVAYTLNESHQQEDHAAVRVRFKNASGAVVASVNAGYGSTTLDYLAPEPGGAYTVEMTNLSTDLAVPSYSGTASAPRRRTQDLDLELWSPNNTRVAQAANTSTAKPESLSYTVPSNATGDYILKVISRDYDADWTLAESHHEGSYANVTGRLRNASGSVVASATSTNGSLAFDYLAPAAGNYTLELQNASTDLAATGTAVTATAPRLQYGPVGLKLKNAAGSVVATATGNHPATLGTAVTPGTYTLEATPTGGAGTATMTASVPRQPKMAITYDGNDHATSIDDGGVTVAETLSPSGRVLRRVVTENVTGTVVEDTVFGYADAGDSPAYSRPHGGGTVTTYLGDVIYTGTSAAWQIVNLHGDVVGTTDASGTFSGHPTTDEFGVGPVPGDRLGWLGGKDRFNVGGQLGLIRMGARLYDTNTGRFLSVDPVEGGSCNDYDYVCGDPVNKLDVDGTFMYTLRFDLGATALSPAQYMAMVAANYGKVFPIAGAPATLPGKGSNINLSVMGVPFPVYVSRRSSDGWAFGTRKGHPDHPGWIAFKFYKTANGHMLLQVRGYVNDLSALPGTCAVVLPSCWLFRKRLYRAVAVRTWSPFANNLRDRDW